jgi:uncharacterized repeat protein (TIGR01451 family)
MFSRCPKTRRAPRRTKPRCERLEDRLAPAADLSVATLVSDPNPDQGGTITYTVTVNNNGSETAAGVIVRDQVPDFFRTPANISDGGTVPANTNDVEWSGLSIPAGGSLQLTYDVTVGTNNTFIAPSAALGALAWDRPTSASAVATYQGWETFSSTTGPNAPQTLPGPDFGGKTGQTWPTVNAAGTPNAFDSSAPGNGSILTSTANIYSPSTVVTPRVIVPNNLDGVPGNNPSGWTTILLQLRAAGQLLDQDSVKLDGSILPVDRTLLATLDIPGLGARQSWAFEFQVPGNADSYTLDFAGAGTSFSFDRVAVDTIWKSDAANQTDAYSLALPLVFADGVQVTGAPSQFTPAIVTIGTTPPTIASNGGGAHAAISVGESSTAVTTVAAADPEVPSLQKLTYSIAGGADATLFQIDADTGALSFLATPAYDAPADAGANNVYNVVVRVSDQKGGIDSQALAITVTNDQAAPTITGIAPFVGPTIGFTVVITGTGFTGATKVTFGGADVLPPGFTIDSDTKITATAPPGTGTVAVTVTTTSTSVPTAFTPGIDQIIYAAPRVVSVTPNGNLAAFVGAQHSKIVSLVVTFNQAVALDASAITLLLHTKGVVFDGMAQPNGYGAVPATLNLETTDNVTWVVTFSGNTDDGLDGTRSLRDGVYDIKVEAAKVHPLSAPAMSMASNWMSTIHRLFGDSDAPATPPDGTPGTDFTTVVNTGDNLILRDAFNNPAGYLSYLDFDGSGVINTGDNFEFRGRFNKTLTWKT